MIWLWMAVACGFFNAWWSALSKRVLEHLTPREFTLVFRGLTCLFLLPLALLQWTWHLPSSFWIWALVAGFCEGLRTWFLAIGVQKDYYSSYAFFNLNPFFTVLIAPVILHEAQPPTLVLGGVLIAIGAFLFHRMGRWSWPGLWGALFSTAGVIASKKALDYSEPLVLAFWSFGVAALFLIPLEALGGHALRWNVVRNRLGSILPVAFWSLVATVLFYTALAHAPASKINPLVRANLLFGFLFSYYLLKEREGWGNSVLAGGFIMTGLLLVAFA